MHEVDADIGGTRILMNEIIVSNLKEALVKASFMLCNYDYPVQKITIAAFHPLKSSTLIHPMCKITIEKDYISSDCFCSISSKRELDFRILYPDRSGNTDCILS